MSSISRVVTPFCKQRVLEEREKCGWYPLDDPMIDYSDINSNMRTILVDWLLEVAVMLKTGRNTLHLAILILDQYLQRNKKENRDKLQLTGVVSLLIASTKNETFPPGVDDMNYICDGAYTDKQFFEKEKEILRTLDGNLEFPTIDAYLHFMHMSRDDYDPKFLESAQFMTEETLIFCCMCRTAYAKYLPSLWATAAHRLSCFLYGREHINPFGHLSNDIIICAREIIFVVDKIAKSSLKAVQKFHNERLDKSEGFSFEIICGKLNEYATSLIPFGTISDDAHPKYYNSACRPRKYNAIVVPDGAEVLGKGTYSIVYKVNCGGKLCAYKKFLESSVLDYAVRQSSLREISILTVLDHPNIISPIAISDNSDGILFPLMSFDLKYLVENRAQLSTGQKERCTRQLVGALAYCHSLGIIHRDVKPENILCEQESGQLTVKLADFGLVTPTMGSTAHTKAYSDHVCTLWYRPPELLLGERNYTESLDIWSLGCVIHFIYKERTLFREITEVGMLKGIAQRIGTPTVEDIPHLETLPYYKDGVLDGWKHTTRSVWHGTNELNEFGETVHYCAKVIDRCIVMSPTKRASTEELLVL